MNIQRRAAIATQTLPKRIVTQEGVFPTDVAAADFPNRK